MTISVEFDKFKYPHRVLLKCFSAAAVEEFLQSFIRSKFERGYRLRVVPDYILNTVELQSPASLRLNMALRVLKEHYMPGQVYQIKWIDFWDLMQKQGQ